MRTVPLTLSSPLDVACRPEKNAADRAKAVSGQAASAVADDRSEEDSVAWAQAGSAVRLDDWALDGSFPDEMAVHDWALGDLYPADSALARDDSPQACFRAQADLA